MVKMSLYDEAHVIVAAVRVLEFRKSASPSLKEISDILGMNIDRVTRISNDIKAMGIVDMVDGPFESINLIVTDHQKIEEISREVKEIKMEDEIRKFQEKSKNAYEDKVKAFTMESKKKEKALFEALQKKFKDEVNKGE
jgi:DNA-directed RNA polymerase specialized sigma subunit